MKKCFFTMVELLIVISIIMILASILLPALGRAKESVRRTVCQNNLKQIGLTNISYQSDYNDFYVPYISGSPAVAPYWPALLAPYLKDIRCFLCPSNKESWTRVNSYMVNPDNWTNTSMLNGWYNPSYGINYEFLNGNVALFRNESSFCPAKSSYVNKPSRTVMMMDAEWRNNINKWGYFTMRSYNVTSTTDIGIAKGRHTGSTDNVLWADAHVSNEKLGKVFNPLNDRSLDSFWYARK